MKSITFIDLEIQPETGAILDMGAMKGDGETFHLKNEKEYIRFLTGTDYLCGHNIVNHDLKYLKSIVAEADVTTDLAVDTLFLSALLFPKKPYHALLKDEKLQNDELNNPLSDAIKAKELFEDEIMAFRALTEPLKKIYFLLLGEETGFKGFFHYLDYKENGNVEEVIRSYYADRICEHTDLIGIIEGNPVELAYALVLIQVNDRLSILPPWIVKNYPDLDRIMDTLRNRPCIEGCPYCDLALDGRNGLMQFFGFEEFRSYDGEPLQEKAVQAALRGESLLAVFPTGGGKSITFQIPALMSGASVKGLTVVISPLQSLMKDQVDNLERSGIIEAVTINGLLDPIERAKSFERVKDGSASLLYISPESLRSRSIEHLLLGRKIVRFVIDEAHCFSSWGQDFRVDYLYIADFIKALQEKKSLLEPIPVSCFTATAKPKVIEDIRLYFYMKLELELDVYSASVSRSNLHYKVIEKKDKEDKYNTLRNLIESKPCPTIVYVSRTKSAFELAQRLCRDGLQAKPYYGKMNKQEKSENQDAFIAGEISIMVATSAFGMGVDKKDVGMVIHYDISDSLENYLQEAGRAGRDESLSADCYVLYCEEDLNKHFILLNQTKITMKEIQQVWYAIKNLTKFKKTLSQSALEIARKAGWDENVRDIETRVKTAVSALEESGYLKRGQNMPRIYADSITCRNVQQAIETINKSWRFIDKEKETAIRIIKKLVGERSRAPIVGSQDKSGGATESRVDYICDHLGLTREEVIHAVNMLREEGILGDNKDLNAYLQKGNKITGILQELEQYHELERFLLGVLTQEEKTYNLKELNGMAGELGLKKVTVTRIKDLVHYWAVKRMLRFRLTGHSYYHMQIQCLLTADEMDERVKKRQELARFAVSYLEERSQGLAENKEGCVNVVFSVLKLKQAYEESVKLFKMDVDVADVEDALFYLKRMDIINIDGGFLVIYNRLNVERLVLDNKIRYKLADYQKLQEFYNSKVEQIHIVGEYAHKMVEDYQSALLFVEDYFQLSYESFLQKYFKGRRGQEIRRNITPAKFRQLFGELSPSQLEIITDKDSQYLAVLAGPGSGKTRVLAHKLASLILMEDVKHEQMLMLTFSRAAATEFKKRLRILIGDAVNFIEIKTFHSYCFDLQGVMGNVKKSNEVIPRTVEMIRNGDVEASRIMKSVLVIDEAQDMDVEVYNLVETLMQQNEEMRVIAVGDDDQNIFEFRGSSAEYLEKFLIEKQATKYELLNNYRSKRNLVEFSNQFVKRLSGRLKERAIVSNDADDGIIRVIRYASEQLIVPVVQDISNMERRGSSCVLTSTNDEALQVTGLLIKNGVVAKLIQSNEGFSLGNLVELRYFHEKLNQQKETTVIDEDTWRQAKLSLVDRYSESNKLRICKRIVHDFEVVNPDRKYLTDFEMFVRESKLEDFQFGDQGEVFVSTIHKSKGKEFDNIYLMLSNFSQKTLEDARKLYVAITRAKSNLFIYTNGNCFDAVRVENMMLSKDALDYPPPKEIAIQVGYKDVFLDYFIGKQKLIDCLQSGDELSYEKGCCVDAEGRPVVRFSKRFMEQVQRVEDRGYVSKSAKVNYMIYWQKEGSEVENKIILPQLYFERPE